MDNNKTLKGKDLITIGIFSAIYFVINFIFMILSGLHPIVWILLPALISLLSGIPYMLMCTKVQKFGAVLIMGFITGLIYFVTGQFTVIILLSFLISCLLAELVRYLFKYNTFKGNAVSFVLFSLGMVGSPLPVWLIHDSFFNQLKEQGMSADYIATLEGFSSTPMLIVLFVAPIICSIIGLFITKAMFNKHFKKAGML